jgi:hypothetical protein
MPSDRLPSGAGAGAGAAMTSSYSAGTKKPGLEDRASSVAGAENRNRTYDLRVTSALLYRLSYFGNIKHNSNEVRSTTSRCPLKWRHAIKKGPNINSGLILAYS